MHKALSIIIVFLAIFPMALYVLFTPQIIDDRDFSLPLSDRDVLLEYSYQILYDHFDLKDASIDNYPALTMGPLNYDILFVTLLYDGKVRGCQSGSNERSDQHRIFHDIQEAVVESINDDRFGGIVDKNELDNCTIMFTFLYNISWLYNKTIPFLQNNIELGIHSVEILYNNTPTIFKESVPISDNYDLEYMLQRLCNKADLGPTCYTSDDVDLFRYDTLTFMGERGSESIELYRYSLFVNISDITQERIFNSILMGSQWYKNSINPETKRLEYLYYPSDDVYSTDDNQLRQMASIWAMAKTVSFLNDSTLSNVIYPSLDYYLSFTQTVDDYSYIFIDSEAKLASNAFLILSLLDTPEYPNRDVLIDRYAKGILSLQHENGSFDTYFLSDKNTGVDYYPGEAMLALMDLYLETQNESYIQSVADGFEYYREYWRANKNTAFIPWHTQTYALLFDVTKRMDVARFIFEMNDWIIDNYQINYSMYKDEIGGFPRYFPTFSTSVFLEGIADAYLIALSVNDTFHTEKYHESLELGTRFIIQTQWTLDNSFYLENTSRAIGGFKTSLTDNSIRIDNTQHAVMALMKIYDLNLVV